MRGRETLMRCIDFIRDSRGEDLADYALLVALIGLALTTAIMILGVRINVIISLLGIE